MRTTLEPTHMDSRPVRGATMTMAAAKGSKNRPDWVTEAPNP